MGAGRRGWQEPLLQRAVAQRFDSPQLFWCRLLSLDFGRAEVLKFFFASCRELGIAFQNFIEGGETYIPYASLSQCIAKH